MALRRWTSPATLASSAASQSSVHDPNTHVSCTANIPDAQHMIMVTDDGSGIVADERDLTSTPGRFHGSQTRCPSPLRSATVGEVAMLTGVRSLRSCKAFVARLRGQSGRRLERIGCSRQRQRWSSLRQKQCTSARQWYLLESLAVRYCKVPGRSCAGRIIVPKLLDRRADRKTIAIKCS